MSIVLYTKGEDGQPVKSKEWASWTDMALDGGYLFMVTRSGPGEVQAEVYTGQPGLPRPIVRAISMRDLVDALDLFFESQINVHDDRYVVEE